MPYAPLHPPSKQTSFYVFGVGWPLINVFLRVYFDVFPQSLWFHFRTSNLSSIYVLWVFVDSIGGGPLVNVFLRVYFDVFRKSSCFNFRPSNQSSFYVFGVFVDSRGRGDPCKTYSWGSILTFFDKVRVLIFAHQNRVRSMFLEFL